MSDSVTIKVFLKVVTLVLCVSMGQTNEQAATSRDPDNLKTLFRNQRPSEPYTYPGPSPSVPYGALAPHPYPMYSPSRPHPLDLQPLPKWCENMWEREDCGMKCWMLRKICWNIAKHGEISHESNSDSDSSQSISYPYVKPAYPLYPSKTVSYNKAGISNVYMAQPSWYYPYNYNKRYPSSYYRRAPPKPEYGLNPQFTYIDGDDRRTTTTPPSTTTMSETIDITTEAPNNGTSKNRGKEQIIKLRGPFGVKVTTVNYPVENEVATLSPLMFDYDQYSTKKYYGDRFYMSAMMPVSDRKLHSDNDYSDFDDLDDLLMLS